MVTRPCLDCGRPGTTGRCPTCKARHQQTTDQRRGTPAQRGYDADHYRRAADLRAKRRPCCLCHGPIDYLLRTPHPLSFTAHHLTGDKLGPMDAAHRVCNERAGRPRG